MEKKTGSVPKIEGCPLVLEPRAGRLREGLLRGTAHERHGLWSRGARGGHGELPKAKRLR